MKVRFEVSEPISTDGDSNSLVTLDINPANLTNEQRTLIADHLRGIDIYALRVAGFRLGTNGRPKKDPHIVLGTDRIRAQTATLESLIEAIKKSDERVQLALRRQTHTALAR